MELNFGGENGLGHLTHVNLTSDTPLTIRHNLTLLSLLPRIWCKTACAHSRAKFIFSKLSRNRNQIRTRSFFIFWIKGGSRSCLTTGWIFFPKSSGIRNVKIRSVILKFFENFLKKPSCRAPKVRK